MTNLKNKLLMLGLASSMAFSTSQVYANPFETEEASSEEPETTTVEESNPFGDDAIEETTEVTTTSNTNVTVTEEEESNSFKDIVSGPTATIALLAFGVIVFVLMKVFDKNKKQ